MNARPQRYDLIAFDWDGTLYNSTGIITRCLQNAVVAAGGVRPSDEAAAWVIGMALPQALVHVAPDVPPECYGQLADVYRREYLAHQDDIELFDGVLPMLAALRAPPLAGGGHGQKPCRLEHGAAGGSVSRGV